MAHQFWISYHPPTGSKHSAGGDETPPIPEEELEAQKIEHECQIQKAAERQAREAVEDEQLDLELLHQRAIEAGEEHRREMAAATTASTTANESRGMNTSSSHHELQRWRQGRPSIPDGSGSQANVLTKASSAQLCKQDSLQSILCESDGIFMKLSRLAFTDEHGDCRANWRNSGSELSLRPPYERLNASSIPGCRAPIASLDCMDEFSANSQQMIDQTKAETEFGRILKKRGVKRSGIIITTKVYWSTKSDERGLSRKHIVESVKASLARLQIDYIDVVLLHKVDPMCPMEEMVRTMKFIINQGWAMYWGTARWSPNEIMEAYTNCRQFNCICPIVEQTEYHMFCREKAELHLPELYHKIGVGMMAWSAITTGKGMCREDLTTLFAKSRFNRKYSTFSWCEDDITAAEPQRSIAGSKEAIAAEEPRTYGDKLRDLSNLAIALNCSLSQMAIAWCLKNENVNCVLLGATSVAQLRENIDALQVVPQLTATVMADVEAVLGNKPVRPPMVSTLAMRTQQQAAAAAAAATTLATTNSVHIDLSSAAAAVTATASASAAAATSGAGTPKPETAGEALALEDVSTPGKETTRGGCEESLDKAEKKENKPKFFLNNAGEVIRRTETENGVVDVVVSVSSLKGKQPASGGSKVKKSKSETASRTRSSSMQRSASGQLSTGGAAAGPALPTAGTSRRRSRIDLASPSPCDV